MPILIRQANTVARSAERIERYRGVLIEGQRIALDRIQRASKRIVSASEFARGAHGFIGGALD